MPKNTTSTRLDNHEKLCRIMQKQTHDKINDLEKQINRF